jgi:hypothetical protein
VEDATATDEAEDLRLRLDQGVAAPDDLRVLQPQAARRAGEVGGGRGARRAESPPPAVASISAASVAGAASSRRWRGRGRGGAGVPRACGGEGGRRRGRC